MQELADLRERKSGVRIDNYSTLDTRLEVGSCGWPYLSLSFLFRSNQKASKQGKDLGDLHCGVV